MFHFTFAPSSSAARRGSLIPLLCIVGLLSLPGHTASAADSPKKIPLRILLITGGCCHNYTFQAEALKEGVSKLAQAEWKFVNEGGTGTQAMIPLYDDPNWAKGYDAVVHNVSPTPSRRNTSGRSRRHIMPACLPW